MKYVVYSEQSGEIIGAFDCPADSAALQLRPGDSLLEGEAVWGQQYVLNGALADYTPSQAAAKAARPSYPSVWSNTTFSWEDLRSLAQQRLDHWERIKSSRNTAITAPLTTLYGVFDADVYSQKNITDAIAMLQALSAAGYSQTVEYTLYDNTVAILNTAQMVEVGLALGQRTQAAYATARSLRAAIEAATSINEIESITWPA